MSRIPDDQAASETEVVAAIAALTDNQLLKIQKYAEYKIDGLGGKALGKDWQDLLQTALLKTISRERHWNKKNVDFFGHMTGTIRSIASHWRQEFQDCEPRLESELIRPNASGEMRSPLDQAPDHRSGPAAEYTAQELLHKFENLLGDDDVGLQILLGLRDGMSPAEIRDLLNLGTKEYETAVKRVRRRISAYNRGIENA